MRTISRLAGFMSVAALVGIISCSDSENAQLSPAVKQYLSMRMGSNSAMAEGMSGSVNQSFQSLFNQAFSPNGRIAGDSSEIPPDTAIIEDTWQSCAVITNTINEDGSQTTTYDYGDGCEEGWGEYKYFMFGKYANTYLDIFSQAGTVFKNSFYYHSVYDNYGGRYNDGWSWLMDGGGTYEGESEYDTATQKFAGSYSYTNETTYQYDSTEYYFKGTGTTRYTSEKYVIESSDNTYTYGDDYYKSKVLKPLVADYSCYRQDSGFDNFCFFWMFVEGRERIQYKNGEEEGSFEIDYGNGECDNIIVIYEDGKKTVIDLGGNWF